MSLQEIIKRLYAIQNNLWYAKHSEDCSKDYINGALDDINALLKALGELNQ